jgi:hypothetical protein
VVRETRLQRQHRNCRAEATSRWSVHGHRCNCVTHTHGGLTPAALAGTFASRRTVLDFCDSPLYHPPRRADTRRSWECAFVHRTNRFFPDKRSHCTKSGGRKPPVGYKTPLQIATAFLQQSARGQPGATGVSPPWDVSVCELETRKSNALPLQTWFPTSGRLTPVSERKRPQLQLRYSYPRRADTRRSCWYVRESANSARFLR